MKMKVISVVSLVYVSFLLFIQIFTNSDIYLYILLFIHRKCRSTYYYLQPFHFSHGGKHSVGKEFNSI